MRLFVYLSLAVFSLQSLAADKTIEQYWAETKLSMDDVASRLSIPFCSYGDSKNFYTCVKAAPSNGVAVNKNTVLVPTSILTELEYTQKDVLKTYGPLSLVLVPRPVVSAEKNADPTKTVDELKKQMTPREILEKTVAMNKRVEEVIQKEVWPSQAALAKKVQTCAQDVRKRLRAEAKGKKFSDEEKQQREMRRLEEFKACQDVQPDLVVFWQVSEFIQNEIVKDADLLSYGASLIINDLAQSADGHAAYMPTKFLDEVAYRGDQKLIGIGMEFASEKEKIVVQGVIEKSPAALAGMKPRDIVYSITPQGQETIVLAPGTTSEQVRSIVLGEPNTEVKMVVIRNGQQVELTMTRKEFVVKNVKGTVVNEAGLNFGHVRIKSFGSREACSDLIKTLYAMDKDTSDDINFDDPTTPDDENKLIVKGQSSVDGWILDVRGNPGGHLQMAECVSGAFVGQKPVVQIRYLDPQRKAEIKKGPFPAVTQKPMVVLIDGISASASEIVAGALQDHQVAWLVGDNSFGKGSVQDVDYPEEKDALKTVEENSVMYKRTIALFHQPSGRTNQLDMIVPDFNIPAKPNATKEERFTAREKELVPNAIKGPQQAPWAQPRPDEQKRIATCAGVDAEGTVAKYKEKYEAAEKEGRAYDYRLGVAQEILKCAAAVKIPKA